MVAPVTVMSAATGASKMACGMPSIKQRQIINARLLLEKCMSCSILTLQVCYGDTY